MAVAFPYMILAAGVFLGAIVQGVAGFAFSAVAGVFLLRVRPPGEAVPLMMACSVIVQATTLLSLRRVMQWGGDAVLICGGMLGLLPALYLLHHVDTWSFRVFFGMLIASYSAYMFLRCMRVRVGPPALAPATDATHQPLSSSSIIRPAPSSSLVTHPNRLQRWPEAALGFASGLVGGLTAMPGALPTIWCDLHDMPKDRQRGVVQPFIASMQVIALVLLWTRRDIPVRVMTDMMITLPPLAAGSAIGITLFTRVDDRMFKRIVLATLFAAGLGLGI